VTQPAQKPGVSKQDYATPAEFIAAVQRRLGVSAFAHDFAAGPENTKAATFFDEQRDALSVRDWSEHCADGWGWLNPPFATIAPWAKKCRETKHAGGSIAFLVPAGVGANWFRDHVDGQARVLLLNGRLAFMPDKPTWLYPKDCILCLYSPRVTPGYEVWTWKRR
jgi:phage N-6-adenine-methyltransferase